MLFTVGKRDGSKAWYQFRHCRGKRDPQSLYHTNLLGSYDFSGAYQHAEWHPNSFSLEMIDDEQYSKKTCGMPG